MKHLALLPFLLLALVPDARWLCAAPPPPPAAPAMGIAYVLPAVLSANKPTTVTCAIPIPDPSLISNSVNLLRNGPSGAQPIILGLMHDDGQNGDAVAGDHIFSLQVTFNEATSKQIQLQVSAAFRGLLKRSLSTPINVAVTADGTQSPPPDPGPAGLVTLGGIDSDGDGVRDDVQRYIALNYASSMKTQLALTQLAKAYLAEVLQTTNPLLAPPDSHAANYALDCLFYVVPSTAGQMLTRLEGQVFNTRARLVAYLTAEGNMTTNFDRLPTPQQQKARCMVNPDTLTN